MRISKSNTTNLPWLGILLFIVLAIAFLLPVLPNDFWWYLRLGQDILTTHQVPLIDTYSSTAYGNSVSYPMWLSGVIFYVLYQLGGLSSIVLLRGISIAIFILFLWLICVDNGLPGWISTLLTLVCALAGANNWAIRPQMLIYPLFGASLFVLHQASTGKPGNLKWLIPISLLWANLHGSVTILFLLVGSYWLFTDRNKKLLLIMVLTFLATLINPRGIFLWSDTLNFIGSGGIQFSQEWNAPSNIGWQMNIFFGWLLLFIPLAAKSPKPLKIYQWVWLLGFGWMALIGIRHIIWFLAILLIFSAYLLSGWKFPELMPAGRKYIRINIFFLSLMIVLSTGLIPGIRQAWWKDSPPTLSGNTPVLAASWLAKQMLINDNIFNDYVFGSYLIHALPDHPVYIDTRFHLYPPELWQDYLSITKAEPGWNQKLSDYHINTLFLDPESQPVLIAEIMKTPGWCLNYRDPVAVLFTRCE